MGINVAAMASEREGFLVRSVRYQVSAAIVSVLIGNDNTPEGASTMTPKTLKQLAAIVILCTAATAVTGAVGNGLPFMVDEDAVKLVREWIKGMK